MSFKKNRIRKKYLTIVSVGFLALATAVFAAQYYRVNNGTQKDINEWGLCFNVKNSAGAKDLFVPTNSATEWMAFIASTYYAHNVPGVTVGPCVASGSCPLPWGGTIANGSSVTAYRSNSWACLSSCSGSFGQETRTCSNGVLSGSYTYQSCTGGPVVNGTWSAWSACSVGPPIACNISGLAWQGGVETRTCNGSSCGGTCPGSPTLACNTLSCGDCISGWKTDQFCYPWNNTYQHSTVNKIACYNFCKNAGAKCCTYQGSTSECMASLVTSPPIYIFAGGMGNSSCVMP